LKKIPPSSPKRYEYEVQIRTGIGRRIDDSRLRGGRILFAILSYGVIKNLPSKIVKGSRIETTIPILLGRTGIAKRELLLLVALRCFRRSSSL
jgi:hypothetical protein